MAEQNSHHVVNIPESASGSPLVDVPANATNTTHEAVRGTHHSTSTTAADSSASATTLVPRATSSTTTRSDSGAAAEAAEPSAGETAKMSAPSSVGAPNILVEEHSGQAHGEDAHGINDDGSQGDGQVDDRSTADISVDVSVHSDTDTSRADGSEKKDGLNHVRTNSSKKPTTFSKITATKSFLNKVATTTISTAKTGEKLTAAPAPAQPANKPRLIAKTGASQSMLKPRTGSLGAGAPDANKVWNKNRPVAPPPPKQFTDEELKQQYGIHLATRLQTDDSKKDSNWADIDDDEDDWAPEAVVWMDGTKSTVAPQDAAPSPPQDEKKPVEPQPSKPVESAKPTLTIKRSDRPEQAMRILKPGAAATQAKQNGGPLAPNSGGQKSGLTAKGSAAAPPSKSPWAPVPKPDAVSPINPPVMQPPPPQRALPSQDARASEPAQLHPTREIAADTFDRSWREGEGGARELFNSSNGRYEPVSDGRRSSMKQDSYRKPAVLQRPSQVGASPAEPSPAFQSRSNSQLDGSSWGRRRGSSVSQGSMPPGRRMSMNRGPELGGTREIPAAASTTAQLSAPGRTDAGRPNFAQQSAWAQQMPPRVDEPKQEVPVEPLPIVEDPVAVQERIMKEKREAARRRKEEEEREEAAKQERLKAKLAALEGAGKSRSQREAEAARAAAAAKEASTAEPAAANASRAAQPEPVKSAAAPTSTNPPPDSQALPRAPDNLADPSSIADQSASPSLSKAQPAGLPERPVSSTEQQQERTAPATGSRVAFQQQQQQQPPPSSHNVPPSSYSSPGERKPQLSSFGRSPIANNDKFTPWQSTSTPPRDIWGSAGIGNGTFNKDTVFAPLPIAQPGPSLPPPPGMTQRPVGPARISPSGGFNQDSRSPSLGPQQVNEQRAAFPQPAVAETRSEVFAHNHARLNGASSAPGHGRPNPSPGVIGPPSRTQQHQPYPHSGHGHENKWQRSARELPQQYRDQQQEQQRQQLDEPAPAVEQPRFRETFKQTSANPTGALGGKRTFVNTEYTIHDKSGSRSVPSLSPAPPTTQTQSGAPAMPSTQERWEPAHSNTVRMPDPSQNPAHGGLPRPIAPPHLRKLQSDPYREDSNAPLAPATSSKEQSPPPPESESHPVHEGDHRPFVKLPPPQAKVRLPPMSPQGPSAQMTSQQSGPVLMPQRAPSNYGGPPGVVRPITSNPDWQARFNGLFNRTPIQTETPPSPPRTPPKPQDPVLAVASSSRALMDTHIGGATVSLPAGGKLIDEDVLLGIAEDMMTSNEISFDDELSFGSMPKVRIARDPNYSLGDYALHSKNMLTMGPNSKLQKSIDSGFRPEVYFWRNPLGIFVKIPYTRLNNKLCRGPGSEQNQPGPNSRKQGHAPKGQHDRVTEERRSSARTGKHREGREQRNNKDNVTGESASAPARDAPTSKKSSQKAEKTQVPTPPAPAPPAASAKPATTAKEALTDKRVSGGSKSNITFNGASGNRFAVLNTSPMKSRD